MPRRPRRCRFAVTNADNDTIGVIVNPTSCSTTPGTTATFSVVLSSQPGAERDHRLVVGYA